MRFVLSNVSFDIIDSGYECCISIAILGEARHKTWHIILSGTSQAESLVWEGAWMAGMGEGHEPFSSLPRYNLSIETPNPRLCSCLCSLFNIFQWLLYRRSMCKQVNTFVHIYNICKGAKHICANTACTFCTSATCLRDKITGIEPGIPGHSSHSPHLEP